jgi:hypothetical protein
LGIRLVASPRGRAASARPRALREQNVNPCFFLGRSGCPRSGGFADNRLSGDRRTHGLGNRWSRRLNQPVRASYSKPLAAQPYFWKWVLVRAEMSSSPLDSPHSESQRDRPRRRLSVRCLAPRLTLARKRPIPPDSRSVLLSPREAASWDRPTPAAAWS